MFPRFAVSACPRAAGLALVCLSAVTSFAAPQLRLSTAAVVLYVEQGDNPPAQTLNAFNIGDGSLNLSITSSASWLSASPGALATCTGGPVTACIPIRIAVSTANLAVGTYTESLTITGPNAIDSPQNVTVTVQVNGAPSAVDLYVTPPGGPMPTASVTVNTGGTVQSSVKTADGGNWLSFTAVGGGSFQFFTRYLLSVNAQPGQSGNYTGTVTLSGSTFAPDNQTINVSFHVTSQPILRISPINIPPESSVISFQNVGLGALSITSATVSLGLGCQGSWVCYLVADVVSPTSVALRATCSGAGGLPGCPYVPIPGTYSGALTLNSNAANTAIPFPTSYIDSLPPTALSFGGVVDNATFAAGMPVASGSIAAVFGSTLAAGPTYASSFPLPTTLGGIRILVNGAAAPLFYIDANQADIQVPFGLTAGTMLLQAVVNGVPGNIISAQVDSIVPGLFPLKSLPAAPDGTPYGIVVNASDGKLALPSDVGLPAHPARPGDLITIYALGLGPVSPPVATGSAAPASEPLARTSNSVQVYFGGSSVTPTSATPSYAGLAPNLVGLYQVNVTIPPGAPVGDVPVALNVAGNASNVVEMAIEPTPAK